jgi:sugar-specific transcriptional regulator TrmB
LIDGKIKDLENSRKDMNKVIKELDIRKDITKPISILSSFEGLNGMKSVLDSIIQSKKNKTFYILGSPKKVGEQVGGYLKEWQKKRIKSKVICKIISDIDAPSWDDSWWKKSKKDKLTFTKRSKSVSPAYLIITDSSVATIYFSSKILSFIIEQPEIASRYKQFFDEMWKISFLIFLLIFQSLL